ncbi:hypothetical protein [Nocardioides daeguensis]|uniref:Sulfotransferase family protein n=1 Tax=Nocardioides daeguensis TaxID=908359 RepID=A0ABP6VSJ9_9ACTN|nr:hypothetical protein [Nocardioides daeguensis]MBV6728399.1 hypothetical protein [Nocardioides daeguensis]MCR1773823.1 hypothetical protein [Nocardioides daeguensis]
MAQRVVLHIGTMKSGTSFLQNVLGENKAVLAERGVLFPGRRWRRQVRAVKELIGHGGPGQPPMPTDGMWQELVAEIEAWPGTAVVSMEYLAPRDEKQIQRIRKTFPHSRVEAVLTCRDLARNVPAMWLESVQNGGVTGWDDYVAALGARKDATGSAARFWRHQDVPSIAARWAKALDKGALTLVTVPPSGAPGDLLWRRFAEVLGIDAHGISLDVRSNPSIDLPSALLLLELNRRFRPDGRGELPPFYDRLVKHQLAKRGLSLRQGGGQRLGYDDPWAAALGEEQMARLRKGKHRVVGDLDELRPLPVRGLQPADIPAEEVLAAALDALQVALTKWSTAGRGRGEQE